MIKQNELANDPKGVATIVQFPTTESKIRRLDELKRHYRMLRNEEDVLFEEAMKITREEYENGHTLNWLENKPDMTAAELFEELTAR